MPPTQRPVAPAPTKCLSTSKISLQPLEARLYAMLQPTIPPPMMTANGLNAPLSLPPGWRHPHGCRVLDECSRPTAFLTAKCMENVSGSYVLEFQVSAPYHKRGPLIT